MREGRAVVARREVVGVLGGTFDPVHYGHLTLARTTQRALGLARVLLVPAAVPPHKQEAELSPAADREAMLRLALAGEDGLELSTIELASGEVRYTLDTLRALRAASRPVDPVFILGSDSLIELPTWHRFETLLAEFDLVVFDRPGDRVEEPGAQLHPAVRERLRPTALAPGGHPPRLRPALGRGGRVFRLDVPPLAISSREIRARARAGLTLTSLVPPPVARYIQDRGLYGREDRR